jgi:adenylate kinase
MSDNKKAFIFIGPSGSGKGTQLDLLEAYLKEKDQREILRYEAGASLREFAKTGSFVANLVDDTINGKGALMPRFFMVWNWGRRIALDLKENMNFIIEGSPRKIDEKHMMDGALEYVGYKEIYVIHLQLSDDEAVKRLMARGRIDDQEEKIRNRLTWFREEVEQTVQEFKIDSRYKYIEIDGDQAVEKVHQDIVAKLAL